jgi:2-hydroxy-3-oxopropionate reductase
MEKIGFIGLGIMGNPMAGHLLAAGYSVVTTDHFVAAPKELLEKGLKTVKGNKAVAEAADIIITMVPDTPHVADVLFGDNSLSAGLSKGKLVIDMSSISPVETKEFAKKVNATGADYLDAPVSGGEVGAKAASLSIMCGGSDASFERAKPLMEKMGKNITLVGPNGAGQTAKVANQIMVALTIEAVSEALLFASKAGADPAKVRAGADGRPRHLTHPRSAW